MAAVLSGDARVVGGIEEKYVLDRELGRGEFGATYLCLDHFTGELLAYKSISKRKLRTAVDVEDVQGAKNLVRLMLEPDPKLRLTAKQVLEHHWILNAKKASNVPLGDVVKSRLKQFSRMNRFKKRALRVCLTAISS
ncbi:hypothetical protein ZIOFF_016157 [Zingiber officinale]|uniref:Protein kinase domain-containing protein n=1 Tax=Zingiber officinale TaxID=94328 RepID=A0A8J5HG07_ZINOF|nr:hypothetical protein ZIOFF_016157 [Zingiber officinale]